jgi:glutamyl-Q tRNA(Asp) synthetase
MAGFVTRFAPSPTGPLHLGHAFSALTAWDRAQAEGGRFLLRMEDIDTIRCRPEYVRQVLDDLAWLGIRWEGPVMYQSRRGAAYRAALRDLWTRGLLYRCRCRRKDLMDAGAAPQEGWEGPPPYPGTCRGSDRSGELPDGVHLRLDIAATGLPDPGGGDVVLARRRFGTSYLLSSVVDDAAQGVTHVIRGEDMAAEAGIHILLQRLLGLPVPVHEHHRLIRDEHGKRLAKRDDARALSRYRAEGATPEDIRRLVGLG